jgi:uncharacterized protein (DUF2164 family)
MSKIKQTKERTIQNKKIVYTKIEDYRTEEKEKEKEKEEKEKIVDLIREELNQLKENEEGTYT